jgi:hypothetical protein
MRPKMIDRGVSLSARRLLHFVMTVVLSNLILLTCANAQIRNNNEYCNGSGPVRLFLIDVTTPYDQTDKDIIAGVMTEVFSSAKGGDRLVVRTIADSHTRSERLIERCIPYCEAEGFYNRLTKCSDGIIRSDTDIVRQDVLNALRNRLSKFEELKYSDIIRTLDTVAKEESRGDRPFVFYIYSDLIENSDYLSGRAFFYYSTSFLIEGLKKLNLIAPLRDSEVRIAGVGRSDSSGRRPLTINELNKVTEFWKAYFRESGAKSVIIGQNVIRQ